MHLVGHFYKICIMMYGSKNVQHFWNFAHWLWFSRSETCSNCRLLYKECCKIQMSLLLLFICSIIQLVLN